MRKDIDIALNTAALYELASLQRQSGDYQAALKTITAEPKKSYAHGIIAALTTLKIRNIGKPFSSKKGQQFLLSTPTI